MSRPLAAFAALALISCGEQEPPPPAETAPPTSNTSAQTTVTVTPSARDALAPEIEAILEDPLLSPEDKGVTLLKLAPQMRAPTARAEALINALLFLSPEDYGLALDLATTPKATPEIQSAILEDALLREPHIRLPALLRIASSPHSDPTLKATAIAALNTEIGEDYGTNWASWSDAIELKLEGE